MGTFDVRSQVLEERVDDPQHFMRQRYYGPISTSPFLEFLKILPKETAFGPELPVDFYSRPLTERSAT